MLLVRVGARYPEAAIASHPTCRHGGFRLSHGPRTPCSERCTSLDQHAEK